MEIPATTKGLSYEVNPAYQAAEFEDTMTLNIQSHSVVYFYMKRLFAIALCVVALGFVTVPKSKAQSFSISFGNGGCYPQSYGYGNYYGQGYGDREGCYNPYYSGYSQQIYYSSNPYGYRRSYYRRTNRYAYRDRDYGYRSSRRHHHQWQD